MGLDEPDSAPGPGGTTAATGSLGGASGPSSTAGNLGTGGRVSPGTGGTSGLGGMSTRPGTGGGLGGRGSAGAAAGGRVLGTGGVLAGTGGLYRLGGSPSLGTGGASAGRTGTTGRGGQSGGTTAGSGGSSGASLVVDKSSISLGTFDLGKTVVANLTVSNGGRGAAGRIVIVVSPGVTAVGCTGELAAGASCPLTITVTATAPGTFTGSLQISANPGAVTPLTVTLSGVVTGKFFRVSPETIDLGDVVVGVAAPKQVITVTALAAISDLVMTVSGPEVSIDKATTTCTTALAPSVSCSLVVNFLATTPGSKKDSVSIAGGGASGTVFTVPIVARALNPAKLVITPSTPQSFAASVGQTSSPITFSVANAGDMPTGTLIGGLSGPDASNFRLASFSCLVLAPLASCSLSVVFEPKAADGGASRTALLTVSDPSGARSTVSVSLSGTLSQPTTLAISPSTQDLGATVVGTTGTATTFTVVNNGNVSSGTLAVALSSDEFTLTHDTCSGAVLVKDGSCTLAVALKPVAPGAKSAILTVMGLNVVPPATANITGIGLSANDAGADSD
jgi:hypothetical protein